MTAATARTSLAREIRASYAFIERNFFLTRRYWGWEIAFLVYSVAGALSVTLIGAAAGSERLLLTLMVGAITWNYLSVVFTLVADTIATERWEGTLEYTFMAPVRRVTQLLGNIAYAMAYGLVHTAVMVVVMVLFFGLDLGRTDAAGIALVMLAGSFSVVGIGTLAAILPLLYVERGSQMTFVLQSCLLLVSGVYYPVDVLPGWMQVIARFSPVTYVLDGVRGALIDGVPATALLGDLAVLVAMGAVLVPAGIWAFGRAERYARRTGRLKRVG